jgi:3-phosphoglycerate kinase
MKNEFPNLSEAKLNKNTVIIRANLDIRLKNGELVDDTKVKALIPTLMLLQKLIAKLSF